MDKKAKKRIDVLRKRISELEQRLSGAKQQLDDPDEVRQLETQIASAREEIEQYKSN